MIDDGSAANNEDRPTALPDSAAGVASPAAARSAGFVGQKELAVMLDVSSIRVGKLLIGFGLVSRKKPTEDARHLNCVAGPLTGQEKGNTLRVPLGGGVRRSSRRSSV
jgi:hypothetical protein